MPRAIKAPASYSLEVVYLQRIVRCTAVDGRLNQAQRAKVSSLASELTTILFQAQNQAILPTKK